MTGIQLTTRITIAAHKKACSPVTAYLWTITKMVTIGTRKGLKMIDVAAAILSSIDIFIRNAGRIEH